MLVALTGIGLSAAAGLNAYIPVLAVALLARFTDVLVLPAGWGWLESGWAIGVTAVLLTADVVLDKVPAVDTLNDAVQSVVRPASGGLVVAATTAAQDLEASSWVQEHTWVPVVAGILVAALVHVGKATVRPVANLGTGGLAAPVLSTAEDTVAVGLSLAALLVPALVVVGLVVLVAAAVWLLRRRRRRTRAAAAGLTPSPPPRWRS